MIRVLFVSHFSAFQLPGGGVPNRMLNLQKELEKLGVIVTYFDWKNDKISDYDIIHVFKLSYVHFPLILFAKSMTKFVVVSPVVESHNVLIEILLGYLNVIPVNTARRIANRALSLCDVVLPQTKREGKTLNRVYGCNADRMTVMPNGVHGTLTIDEGSSFNKFAIVIGRFDLNKNQLNIVRAFNKLKYPVIYVGGPAPGCEYYFEECKELADSNQEFIGWLDKDDPKFENLKQRADVVVLASKSEIFGNAIYEVAQYGAAIVCPKYMEIPDLFSNRAARIRNVRNVKSIVIAIKSAWQMERANEYWIEKFNKKFSWESIARRHFIKYKELLYD